MSQPFVLTHRLTIGSLVLTVLLFRSVLPTMPVFLVSKPLRVRNIDQFSLSFPRSSNLTTSLNGIDHQAMDLGSWAPGALDEVREAIGGNDTDKAWRCWAEAIGFTSPTTEPWRLNEGWTCGKCHREVHKLWKRLRLFRCR